MRRLFLSHSSEDKSFVRLFGEDLRAAGFKVWLDEVQLKIGDSLPLEIAEAVDKTDFFLAFLSKNSVESNWVKKEVAIAVAREIDGEPVTILPIRLDESNIPPILIDKLYADFRSPLQYDAEFRRVLRSIELETLPTNPYDFFCLTIGETRKNRLVNAAKHFEMTSWLLDYLIGTLSNCDRPAERHFIYVALGEIGSEKARDAVQQGLSDPNRFALKGAQQAWNQLGHKH